MNEHIESEQDELTWLAFQYVAGEFSSAEAEQFEERLATDQGAREAVAQAVELLHTVCAIEAAEPAVALEVAAVAGRGSRRAVVVWRVAIAIAAVVLLVVTLNVNRLNRSSPTAKNVAAVTPALADAWSALRSDFADEGASQSAAASAVLTDAELAIAEEDLAVSTDAPSWMTAAVLGLSGKSQPLDAVQPQPQEN